ncbi:MAG TPA: hypothetical protein VGP18_02515 [Solirubrobacteraceae bacterium]|nr:hypothetical protein [Solirubrobacteraceae bacterium]
MSALLGACNKLETTSAVSAQAIATTPTASQRAGVTPAIRAPSATQLNADSKTPAPWPRRALRSAHANANNGTTNSAKPGRAPCIRPPSASAASSGTAIKATYVNACALACSASEPTATKPTIESAGTSAHRRLCKRAIHAGDQDRGKATTRPWQSDSAAMEAQNGIT